MSPKRKASDSPVADSVSDHESSSTSSPSPKKITKRSPAKTSTPTKGRKGDTSPSAAPVTSSGNEWDGINVWTPEKREALFAYIITQGVAKDGMAGLARMFKMDPIAMKNALQAGKKGNLRDKAVRAVKG